MNWSIRESTENAFVTYLQQQLPAGTDAAVYPGYSDAKIQFPCVVFHVAECEPISENAQWHDARMLQVDCMIATEITPIMEQDGSTIKSPRDRHSELFSLVMNALARIDLLTQLIAVNTPAVAFSMAQISSIPSRSVESEQRKVYSIISMDVIAEPVEGT